MNDPYRDAPPSFDPVPYVPLKPWKYPGLWNDAMTEDTFWILGLFMEAVDNHYVRHILLHRRATQPKDYEHAVQLMDKDHTRESILETVVI